MDVCARACVASTRWRYNRQRETWHTTWHGRAIPSIDRSVHPRAQARAHTHACARTHTTPTHAHAQTHARAHAGTQTHTRTCTRARDTLRPTGMRLLTVGQCGVARSHLAAHGAPGADRLQSLQREQGAVSNLSAVHACGCVCAHADRQGARHAVSTVVTTVGVDHVLMVRGTGTTSSTSSWRTWRSGCTASSRQGAAAAV